MKVVPVDLATYGKFYSGDSYIVLSVSEDVDLNVLISSKQK